MTARMSYNVPLLRELWAKNEETRLIAERLGISSSSVVKEARRLGLGRRPRRRVGYEFDEEPSADQIAEYERRKAEVWARHLEEKRNGTLERGTSL